MAIQKAAALYVKGGMKAVEREATLHYDGDVEDALLGLGGNKARSFVAIALERKVPLLPLIEPWNVVRKTEVKPNTAHMDKIIVERFAKRAKRQRFTPAEVLTLYREALKREDEDLADLIALAAYSGARREELCALSVPEVVKGWFKIADAKTEAGVREVPIHPRIEGIIKRRMGNRKAGYLFVDLDTDKYG